LRYIDSDETPPQELFNKAVRGKNLKEVKYFGSEV